MERETKNRRGNKAMARIGEERETEKRENPPQDIY
jgi:hypothetical protein